jgi:hypothetical protein
VSGWSRPFGVPSSFATGGSVGKLRPRRKGQQCAPTARDIADPNPSLTGINTDTGLSGTTQWHNAVRARFYMKSVKPEDGEQPDTDLRKVVFKKNNYSAISESIVLRYTNGLFLPLPGKLRSTEPHKKPRRMMPSASAERDK